MINFFDALIGQFQDFISPYPGKSSIYQPNLAWPDAGYSEVILGKESAYELDGIGFLMATEQPVTGDTDTITVAGADLPGIKKNQPFARVALVQVADTIPEEKYYDTLKKIEFVKYHYFPEGYMLRTSTKGHKEVVRVAKKALKGGIAFEKVGDLFIRKLREIPEVRGVHLYYLTDPGIDYAALEEMAEKNEQITQTLNRVSNMLTFDCTSCAQKPICDEVDGMRGLHQKLNQQSS